MSGITIDVNISSVDILTAITSPMCKITEQSSVGSSKSNTSRMSGITIEMPSVHPSESKTSPMSRITNEMPSVGPSESKTSPMSGITIKMPDMTSHVAIPEEPAQTNEMPDMTSHVAIPEEPAQTNDITDKRLATCDKRDGSMSVDTSRESCVGILRNEFRLRNFGLSHPTPRLFVSDQWGCPTMYLGWRVAMALYHLAWCLYDWRLDAVTNERPGTWLVYLTNWSYLILTAHCLFAAFLVLKTSTDKGLDDGRILWYIKISWVVYNLAAAASFMVTLLYFIFIFKGTLSPTSAAKHVGNSVYYIVDLCITATPIRLLHAIYPMAYGFIYITFNFIYWVAGGVNSSGEPYVYSTLNWAKVKSTLPVAVGNIFVVQPLMQAIIWSVFLLRVTIHRRCVRRQHAKTSSGGV